MPDTTSDFAIAAWGLGFQDVAWVSYNGSFTSPTAYAAMRFASRQTIPNSSGNWVLGTNTTLTIPEWSALPQIRCTYNGRTVLRAFGNQMPASGSAYTSVVTLFNQDPNFRATGNMSFTDYAAWSATQASMRGVDDFQDGYACSDQWAPQAIRGHSSYLMIR